MALVGGADQDLIKWSHCLWQQQHKCRCQEYWYRSKRPPYVRFRDGQHQASNVTCWPEWRYLTPAVGMKAAVGYPIKGEKASSFSRDGPGPSPSASVARRGLGESDLQLRLPGEA